MKRNKPRTLRLGEISSGTLRAEDLLPSYLWELKRLRLSRSERETVRAIERSWENDYRLSETSKEGDEETREENMSDDVQSLESILDAHCPPYAYFGSTEGDGACFGVWISHEILAEDIESGEVWQDIEGTGQALSKDAHYRLVVSDHGNQTLYTRAGREVWSVV